MLCWEPPGMPALNENQACTHWHCGHVTCNHHNKVSCCESSSPCCCAAGAAYVLDAGAATTHCTAAPMLGRPVKTWHWHATHSCRRERCSAHAGGKVPSSWLYAKFSTERYANCAQAAGSVLDSWLCERSSTCSRTPQHKEHLHYLVPGGRPGSLRLTCTAMPLLKAPSTACWCMCTP